MSRSDGAIFRGAEALAEEDWKPLLTSTQARGADVRALASSILLGSCLGLGIGGAYLIGSAGHGVYPAPGALQGALATPAPGRPPSPEHSTNPSAPRPVPVAKASAAAADWTGALRDRFRVAVGLDRPAAKPFQLASAQASTSDLQCLTEVVYYESRGEPTSGQQAVAQVVLNRVRHPAFPKTVCGVVRQRSAAGCQFTFACRNELSDPISSGSWRRARTVAYNALHGQVMAEVGEATHFQTARAGAFAGLLKVAQIGAHVFYRFAGRAGTVSMFHQAAQPSAEQASASPPIGPKAGQMVVASLAPATGAVSYKVVDASAALVAEHAALTPAKPIAAVVRAVAPPANAAPAAPRPDAKPADGGGKLTVATLAQS